MRYIIISPNQINDPHVYKIAQLRNEFMHNARVVNGDEVESMEIIDFSIFDYQYEDFYKNFNEKKELDGSWKSMCFLNEEVLPDLRKTLVSLIRDKEKDIIHVDLGKSILPLYLAYFAILEGVALNVTFHVPDPTDEKPSFNIGGDSAYSNPRNNLRRYLATQIMKNAMTVFIDDPRIVQILNHLFPRVNREIHLDPLVRIEKEESELQNVK